MARNKSAISVITLIKENNNLASRVVDMSHGNGESSGLREEAGDFRPGGRTVIRITAAAVLTHRLTGAQHRAHSESGPL